MVDPASERLPVQIITGFLGSGKTTLLNLLLKQPVGQSTAVIINEFGEIGIDHLLVETSTEEMIELNNGCICCTIRGDLADKLGSLAMWRDSGKLPPVEHVVLETTGLADPAPIMHTLMTDPNLLNRYRLHGVVTVVDAIVGSSSLDQHAEARKQVAIADCLMLAKKDLVETHSDWHAYDNLKSRVRHINPRAAIHAAEHGKIDANIIFSRYEENAENTFANFSAWLDAAGETDSHQDDNSHDHDHDHKHQHAHGAAGITSFVVELDQPIESDEFNEFLQQLASEFGEQILRMKGILHVRDMPDRPAVIHGVQHVFFPITWLEHWPDNQRSSKLVFITQNLEPERIRSRFREHLT